MDAYTGRNIVLMLDSGRATDSEIAIRVVNAIDAAWDWYRDMFGRAPAANNLFEGRTIIAENAQDPAAAARGRVGQTGIEMGPDSMHRLLIEAGQDRYNQAVFYELGRNFWFFNEQLGAGMPAPVVGGVFTTGFATVNRFYSMESKGIVGAPWDDKIDFDRFRYISLIDTVDRYLADPKLNWENTVALNKPAPGPHGWIAGYHLAAGFLHRIRRDHGFAGYRQFWQLMARAPKAATPREVAANFVRVAHTATRQDYRDLLRDKTLPLS
ncbi:MAG: hypothetical protein FJX62_22225 [Alphaproteobacteria bacterium]|nr:hypothetical protein [Alphaproteobacteria bacterium]